MKNSKIKYIFIIFVVLIIIFSIYYFSKTEKKPEENIQNQEQEETQVKSSNLRLGICNLDNLNPILSKNQNIQDISKLIYEPLFSVSQDFRLENSLGTEISKADSKSYLIKLRENVKWHNGTSFTAEDVKYTIETIKLLGEASIYNSNVTNIDYVEVLSDYLIKIHLFKENTFFEYDLTFPIISSNLFASENIVNSDKNNMPIGTGKYKIESIEINSQMELKRNESWWESEEIDLRIDTITVRIYKNFAEICNAYKLGGLDMITTQNLNIEENIGTIGSNIKISHGRDFDYLVLNNENENLKNKEIRQAISYAINKEEIVNSVYKGKYKVADFPLEYGSYLYNKEISKIEYNESKAKEHIQGNYRFNLVYQATNEARKQVAEIIKKNLEDIGIKITLIPASEGMYQNYLKNKNYDMLLTRSNSSE